MGSIKLQLLVRHRQAEIKVHLETIQSINHSLKTAASENVKVYLEVLKLIIEEVGKLRSLLDCVPN
jgi:hypothetical protein